MAARNRRSRHLRRVEPKNITVAVIAAGIFAAALDEIVVRHDLDKDLAAGGRIDIYSLVAVVDIAVDRQAVAARRQIAVKGPPAHPDPHHPPTPPTTAPPHPPPRL